MVAEERDKRGEKIHVDASKEHEIETQKNTDQEADIGKEKRKRKNKSKSKVTKGWIYITGLPADITIEEMKSHFSKVKFYSVE